MAGESLHNPLCKFVGLWQIAILGDSHMSNVLTFQDYLNRMVPKFENDSDDMLHKELLSNCKISFRAFTDTE